MDYLNTELFLKSLFVMLSERRQKCFLSDKSHNCKGCEMLKSNKFGSCLIQDIYKLSKDFSIKL